MSPKDCPSLSKPEPSHMATDAERNFNMTWPGYEPTSNGVVRPKTANAVSGISRLSAAQCQTMSFVLYGTELSPNRESAANRTPKQNQQKTKIKSDPMRTERSQKSIGRSGSLTSFSAWSPKHLSD